MNPLIVRLLEESTNLTLATSINDVPDCANCFYVFDAESKILIIKSKGSTNHIRQAIKNNCVAGTVLPDTLNRLNIKGIQFRGVFLQPDEKLKNSREKKYYNKYPFARAVPGDIWAVKLTAIKMTDNTLGFGTKIAWSAAENILNEEC